MTECSSNTRPLVSSGDESAVQALLDAQDSSIQLSNSLPSPIHALPNEILTDIFLFTVQAWFDKSIHDFEAWNSTDISPAWPLSQVCTRWRAVAIGCNNIWSLIYVLLDNLDETIGMYQLYVPRAGVAPLSLKILGQWEPSLMDSHMSFLHSLLTRVSSLTCQVSKAGDTADEIQFPKGEGCFRDLITLEIADDMVYAFGDDFSSCTKLRRLAIGLDTWEWEPRIRFPWSQLTSLTIGGFVCFQSGWESLCRLLTTLSQATVLEELGLLLREDFWEGDELEVGDVDQLVVPGKVVLEHLHSLSLEAPKYMQQTWLPWFLQRLSLPRLENLTLNTGNDRLSPSLMAQLSGLAQRSQCGVHSLCLYIGQETPDHELSLSLFPTVRALTIQFDVPYASVQKPSPLSLLALLRMLELRGNKEDLLPHLSVLRLHDLRQPLKNDGAGIGEAIVDLLKSRHTKPIQALYIAIKKNRQGDLLDTQERAYIDDCVEQGLWFSFTQFTEPWEAFRIRELEWTSAISY